MFVDFFSQGHNGIQSKIKNKENLHQEFELDDYTSIYCFQVHFPLNRKWIDVDIVLVGVMCELILVFERST